MRVIIIGLIVKMLNKECKMKFFFHNISLHQNFIINCLLKQWLINSEILQNYIKLVVIKKLLNKKINILCLYILLLDKKFQLIKEK